VSGKLGWLTTTMKLPFDRKIRIRILVICGAIGLVVGAGIFYYLVTEKFSDTKSMEAERTTDSGTLIGEFNSNDSLANANYRDRLIDVRGRVSVVESADTSANIKIIDSLSGSYLIFDFQEQDAQAARTLRAGDSVLLRASCSGSIFSRLLNTRSIQFKRATLIQKF
jgi:hypothetical protein